MVLTYLRNDNGDFYCNTCKFTTPNQNTMHYHMKTHLGKYDHKCTHCDKEFMHKQTLDMHVLAKHEKAKEEYHCKFKGCNFKSLTTGNCRIHFMRMHYKNEISKIIESDENVHTCKSCVKSFKGLTSFYYHAYDCLTINKEFCELKATKTLQTT
jgi:hypothetical protein